MRKVKVAMIQMSCSTVQQENLEKAERYIREAAGKGANVILLPELFDRNYFCQERRYEYYDYAMSVDTHPNIAMGKRLARELGVVLPVSFYEKDGNVLYNSLACIDADGTVLGVYRKTHIPDDHYYQEKFYFTPGNTGFKVFDTAYGKIGIGICWDQWFPETARALALQGAEMILYPTAIGSEPILGVDSMEHWRRVMLGHARANLMPVCAANRIGLEEVSPCRENGFQQSSLDFYGSSFMTDETGAVVENASRDREEILIHEYDLDELKTNRIAWGLFRDRREEMYQIIAGEK